MVKQKGRCTVAEGKKPEVTVKRETGRSEVSARATIRQQR